MSTLYIAEYSQTASVDTKMGVRENPTAAPQEPPIAEQTITISGSSTQCTLPFNVNTHLVRIHSDVICSIAFGTNPTATTANKRYVAGQTEYHGVSPGHLVAAISNV